MSTAERRQRLAQAYLAELSGMIHRSDLRQARALAAALDEAFASDGDEIRQAIADKRRTAGLSRPSLWLRKVVTKSRRLLEPAG
jgi:hypothetical protein